jgi:hypothetical protein
MKRLFSLNSLLVLVVVVLIFSYQLYIHLPNNVLSWDVFGAYLYLPAHFIYDDLFLKDWTWLEHINSLYNNTPTYYQFWLSETGNQVIKYPTGFAVLYAPFFFIGHLWASFGGYPADGFSTPYQYAIIAGHWTYIVLGLMLARKVLLHFFSDYLAALLLLILFFGTNYYFTVIAMVGMPHGHLFMMYALILYYTIKWHQKPTYFNSIALGASLGLACLIRATEIVALLIPLLWNVYDKKSLLVKFSFLNLHLKKVGVSAIIFVLFGLIQLIYFKAATGHFFVDSYNNPGEGFDFLNPHTIDFLFSFRKGWLIYTPIMLFSLIGLFILWKQKSPYSFSLLIFSGITLFILSTWTCWWYAESFGQRSVVQYYLIFMISLGFLITYLKLKKSIIQYTFGTSLLLFIALNQFQTWQVHHGLLHLSRMTPAAYWEHFLAIQPSASFNDLLLIDKSVPAIDRITKEAQSYAEHTVSEVNFDGENWSNVLPFDTLSNGCLVTNETTYSKDIALRFQDMTESDFIIFKVSAMIFPTDNVKETKPTLVCKMRHSGKGYYDQYLEIENLDYIIPQKWNYVEMVFYSPDVRHPKDDLQIFGWIRGQGSFRINNIIITKYEKK